MPRGRDLSAIARALDAFAERAVPYVVELLSAPLAEVRLFATVLAADAVRPALMWPVYNRLFDPDGQVRLVAIDALPRYRDCPGFGDVLKALRAKAMDESEPMPSRLSVLEALSVMRDGASATVLCELCGHGNKQLSVPAHRNLVSITGHDFGNAPGKWKSWLEKNHKRHRIEWLIDGLMQPEERLRAIAGGELQKLTQVYYGYVPTGSKRERERAQRRYRDWWVLDGSKRFK